MIPVVTQRSPNNDLVWRDVFLDQTTNGIYNRENIELITQIMDE